MTTKAAKTLRAANTPTPTALVVPAKRTRAKRVEVAPPPQAIVAAATTPALRPPMPAPQAAAPELTPPARISRRDQIVGMLNPANGASIAELMAATGWLPHTTRAALSGPRKRGIMLDRTSENGISRYRIAVAA